MEHKNHMTFPDIPPYIPELDESGAPEIIVLAGAPPEKVTAYLVRALTGCFVGFALSGLFIQYVLDSPPGQRLLLLIAGTACGLIACLVRGPRFGCRRIEICEDRLLLSGPDCRVELTASDVEVLMGEKRICLDGGELFVWKIIRVITSAKRYVFHVGRDDALVYFSFLSRVCPKAVVIDPAGTVTLPVKDADVSLRHWIDEARYRTKRALSPMVVWQGGLAAGLLLGAGLAVAGIVQGIREPANFQTSRAFIYVIVGVTLSVILAANALRLKLAMRLTVRTLDRLEWGKEWRDKDPLPRIRIGVPDRAASGQASTMAKILTLLALPVFWVPLVGLLLAGLAWMGLRGTTSRLRALSRALAIMATIFTVTVVASVILAVFLK